MKGGTKGRCFQQELYGKNSPQSILFFHITISIMPRGWQMQGNYHDRSVLTIPCVHPVILRPGKSPQQLCHTVPYSSTCCLLIEWMPLTVKFSVAFLHSGPIMGESHLFIFHHPSSSCEIWASRWRSFASRHLLPAHRATASGRLLNFCQLDKYFCCSR